MGEGRPVVPLFVQPVQLLIGTDPGREGLPEIPADDLDVRPYRGIVQGAQGMICAVAEVEMVLRKIPEPGFSPFLPDYTGLGRLPPCIRPGPLQHDMGLCPVCNTAAYIYPHESFSPFSVIISEFLDKIVQKDVIG